MQPYTVLLFILYATVLLFILYATVQGVHAHAKHTNQKKRVERAPKSRTNSAKHNHGQCKIQLLPPAPPYYPFRRGKSILGVIYGVLLCDNMNAATPLGGAGALCKAPCTVRDLGVARACQCVVCVEYTDLASV